MTEAGDFDRHPDDDSEHTIRMSDGVEIPVEEILQYTGEYDEAEEEARRKKIDKIVASAATSSLLTAIGIIAAHRLGKKQ